MDFKKIKELTKTNINAWAVWDNGSMKMPDFSSPEVADLLKPQIIFLGLNPSKSLEKDRNFHSNSVGDKRLKEAIQGENIKKPKLKNLIGGFMTDLTDRVESDSSKVDLKEHSFTHFENVLKMLGENHYHVICFGGKTYETTKNWLLNQKSEDYDVLTCQVEEKTYKVTLYKVMHYSYRYGKNKVSDQLAEVNKLLNEAR